MNRISKTRSASGVPLYQLKITLKWSKPPIWRRLIVPANMTLARLHDVIQIAMGWTNSHLHQFITGKGPTVTYYGQKDPDYADTGPEMFDERRYHVGDLAPAAKAKFIYEYDFGDSWQHDIIVEKILPPDPAIKQVRCLGGANACPPDDCGGIGGYYDLLEILADPKHEEHESMREWLGGEWDAAEFNVDKVDAVLKRLKA